MDHKLFNVTSCIVFFSLVLFTFKAYAKDFIPKFLNDIPKFAASFVTVQVEGTELERLPSTNKNEIYLQLTYKDGQKYWYYFEPTGNGSYSVMIIDCATGAREKLVSVAKKGGGKPVYVEQSLVDKARDLDFSKVSNQIPLSSFTAADSGNQHDQSLVSDDEFSSYDTYDDSLEESELVPVSSNSWTKYLYIGGSATLLLIGYYYLLDNIRTGMRYLSRDDLWSSWKSEEPYDVLLMMKPEYLADDLMQDINVVYYQQENPVELFLRDIQEEADTIMEWMQFRNTLYRFRLPLANEFAVLEKRLKLLDLLRKAVYYSRSQQLSIKKATS